MSSLRPQVRAAIRTFVQSHQDSQIPIDVLRVIQEEAALMKETQEICDMIDADPFEQFGDLRSQMERVKKRIQVTSSSRIRAGFDYSSIDAVVAFGETNNLELTFKYERKPNEEGPGCRIWYSIEVSYNHGERIKLLVVQVFAASGVPSSEKPVCLQAGEEEESEGGWEDIDEDENDAADDIPKPAIICSDSESESGQSRKKQKTNASPEREIVHSAQNEEDSRGEVVLGTVLTHDSFTASMDPEALHDFLESAGLLPMNEASAFFLLMTFPFYEHEWDLVGYVLDEVFGAGSDDESDDE